MLTSRRESASAFLLQVEVKMNVVMSPEWQSLLGAELAANYFHDLSAFLEDEEARGFRVLPPSEDRFAALDATSPDATRVVVLGQDPYPGYGQAHGLSFSVRRGVPVPPSLRNIYKALDNDLGIPPAGHGDLSAWTRQGVLLLNSVLTVREGEPGSHRQRGWERLTDALIAQLAARRQPLVFMLWGRPAQEKAKLIDTRRHLLLTAPHPSPLSAHRGFFDCGHFSRCNNFLIEHGCAPIDWCLPS